MMWLLWLLIGLIALIVILLFLPVSIRIGYTNEVTLEVGVLGLYFPILPKRKKRVSLRHFSRSGYRKLLSKDSLKAKKKKEKAESKKRAALLKKEKKLPRVEMKDETSNVRIILRILGDILNTFCGKIRVKILHFCIFVGGPDASQTALTYAVVSQTTAYIMELLAQKTRFKRIRNEYVSVVPNFLSQKSEAEILIVLQLCATDILHTATIFLIRFLREKQRSLYSTNKSNS